MDDFSLDTLSPGPPAEGPRPLEYVVRQREDATILPLRDDHLTIANVSQFRRVVQELVDEGRTKVILNLKAVKHTDSTGLGALIGMSETLRYARGCLVLLNVNPSIEHLLELTQMRNLFTIVGAN